MEENTKINLIWAIAIIIFTLSLVLGCGFIHTNKTDYKFCMDKCSRNVYGDTLLIDCFNDCENKNIEYIILTLENKSNNCYGVEWHYFGSGSYMNKEYIN